jgi:hypothetical protein
MDLQTETIHIFTTFFPLFQTLKKSAILGDFVLESVNPSIQVQNRRPNELNAKVL